LLSPLLAKESERIYDMYIKLFSRLSVTADEEKIREIMELEE